MNQISMDDIDKCLDLLKNYLYTERNYSLNRNSIASEITSQSEREIKIQVLDSLLNFENDYWDIELSKIDYFTCPKKISPSGLDHIYVNTTADEDISIKELNLFIKFPTSIGIINTLFIYLFGEIFEREISIDCLGNRLNTDEEGKFKRKGFTIYKSYFEQYRKWRNGSIKLSKTLHEQGNDVLLLNLDFKRFFYSVDLNFDHIYEKTKTSRSGNDVLSKVVQITEQIHTIYNEKINSTAHCLPIGLPTSGLFANWILKDFDKECRKYRRVSSYSRYVDDIIMVVTNPKAEEEHPVFKLKDFVPILGKPLILKAKKQKSKSEKLYKIKPDLCISNSKIYVNNSKVRWFYFKKESPISLIEKFIQDTSQLSSEWKLLSDHESLNKDLLSELYRDSLKNGDIKSIKDLLPNKSNLALFFEKSIVSALYGDQFKSDELDTSNHYALSDFYRGIMILDCIAFWDRTFTLLTCLKNKTLFSELVNRFEDHITNVTIDLSEDIPDLVNLEQISQVKVRSDLHNILKDVVSYSTSINPPFISQIDLKGRIDQNEIFNNASSIRKAGFCRRHHTLLPILCIHSDILRNPNIDLTSVDIIKTLRGLPQLSILSLKPFHFVRYSEIKLLSDLIDIARSETNGIPHRDLKIIFKELNGIDYIDELEYEVVSPKQDGSGLNINKVNFPEVSSKSSRKLNIGLASIEIRESEIKDYVTTRKHNIFKNFQQISKILRMAKDEKVDLLVFPETSICLELIPLLMSESQRSGIGLAFGLKHIIEKENVFNVAVTILPDRKRHFGTTTCFFRHKNHFAPIEISEFESILSPSGHTLKCYKGDDSYYLFRWLSVSFTLFNCFELADISHRSAFRGEIDLLVAIEFNKDVPYFSNLIESSVRDLHCVAAQCNSSIYGDSRVSTPVRNEYKKDLVKIKGGTNCYVVVCTFDFFELAEFQKLNYAGQKNSRKFKPTPPGFDVKTAYTRNKQKYD